MLKHTHERAQSLFSWKCGKWLKNPEKEGKKVLTPGGWVTRLELYFTNVCTCMLNNWCMKAACRRSICKQIGSVGLSALVHVYIARAYETQFTCFTLIAPNPPKSTPSCCGFFGVKSAFTKCFLTCDPSKDLQHIVAMRCIIAMRYSVSCFAKQSNIFGYCRLSVSHL